MRLKSDLALLLAALVWGTGFVTQRVAADENVGVFVFNAFRFLLGGLILVPFIFRRPLPAKQAFPKIVITGAFLFCGSALQQAGLEFTTAGNAGFITGLYVVFVPLLLLFIWRKRNSLQSWLAAILAVFGIWLLSGNGKPELAPGDGLVLLGAVFWALHMIFVGKYASGIDFVWFAAGQYMVAGLFHLVLGVGLEASTIPNLSQVVWVVAYNGIFSVACGFTLQVIGQKHSPPNDAAIILSMESVFAVIFGFIFLQERLSLIQILGCLSILAAMLMVQLWRPVEKTVA